MDWLSHLIHAAAWIGGLIILFAVIGVIATFHWIFGLFGRGERAIEGAVHHVGDNLQKR